MPRSHTRRIRRRALPGALLVLAAASQAAAQWIPTRAYGVHDGLAQSQVMALAHDSLGYLWLATQGGVSRFDGVRFVTFTTAEGLPDNVITALAAGAGGAMWLGTDSGWIVRWDCRGFESWSAPDGAGHAVLGLVADDEGLLVATDVGLWHWQPNEARRLAAAPVRQLVAADPAPSGGRAWLLTAATVASVSGDSVTPLPIGIGAATLTVVAAGGARLWLGAASGEVWQVASGGAAERRARLSSAVRAIVPAGDGGAWVGAEDGLWRIRADGGVARQPLVASDPAMEIRCLGLDREGNLWASPWSGGLFRLAPDGFTVFSRASGFPTSEVWGFHEDAQGCMWMATEDAGVLGWCGDHLAARLRPGEELPPGRSMAVAGDGAGGLWIATSDGVVHEPVRGRRRRWDAADGLPDSYVRAVLRARDGSVWAATSGGLARLEGDSWRSWTAADGLPDDNLRALAEDRSGNLWLATHGGGVVRFDGASFRAFGVADGLPHPRVWSLMVDSADRVWAGTDAGIWVHPPPAAGASDRVIAAGAGLASPSVLSLAEDHGGSVWAGTTRGLCRLDDDGVVDLVLTAHDGMAGSEAAESAAAVDRRGRLWIGTADGVTRFDPGRLPTNDVPPRLALERLEVDGAPWPGPVPFAASGLPAPAELRLGPSISDLRLDFAALSFSTPERVRYRFMLVGWDDGPGEPSDERHVTYRHLAPGRYRFVLAAANSDGVWSPAPLELPLRVLPAWHQTWWFRAGGLLAAVLAVVGGFVSHSVGQRRRRAELEQQVAQRTAELAEANRRIVGQNELLSELSRTDPLTGLGNRRVLAELLPLEMAMIRREVLRRRPDPAAYHAALVLLLDIDHFKAVNDRWGHEVGDRVLVAVARALGDVVREVDLAVRWGGEEFLVLARAVDRDGVATFVRRLMDAVAGCRVETDDGAAAVVTVSVGFAPYPLGFTDPLRGEHWTRLVDLADRQLYLAKQRGRDRACGLVWSTAGGVRIDDLELAARAQSDPAAPGPGLRAVEIPRRPPSSVEGGP